MRYQLNPRKLQDAYPTETREQNHRRVLILQREIPDGLEIGESRRVTFGEDDSAEIAVDSYGQVSITRDA